MTNQKLGERLTGSPASKIKPSNNKPTVRITRLIAASIDNKADKILRLLTGNIDPDLVELK